MVASSKGSGGLTNSSMGQQLRQQQNGQGANRPTQRTKAPLAARASASLASDSSDNASANSIDDRLVEAFNRRFSTAPTTPASSVPPTPSPSALSDAVELLHDWVAKSAGILPYQDSSNNEVADALDTLKKHPGHSQTGEIYDNLLHLLANHGDAMLLASEVRTYLQQAAPARIDALLGDVRGKKSLRAGPRLPATLELLGKFKLKHEAKQRLRQLRRALEPKAAAAQAPTPAAGLRGPLLPQPPGQVLWIDKEALDDNLPLQASTLVGASPISVLRLADAGSQVGAAIAVLGATIPRGTFAKVKPIYFLAAANMPPGPYVVRQSREHPFVDEERFHLLAKAYRPLGPSSQATQADERHALQVAQSELLPVLTMLDQQDRLYEVVPRLDNAVPQLLEAMPRLRKNRALAVVLLEGILPALMALHRQGIAHFDIKPDNMLLSAQGPRAVLSDFGLARTQQPGQRTYRGTYRMMAPEMLAGLGMQVTTQADIFSLAVSMAHILAPDELKQSSWNLPERADLMAQPQLVQRAKNRLAALRGDKPRLETAVAGAYVEQVADAYRAWFQQSPLMGGAKPRPRSANAPPASPAAGFDALYLALTDVDPALAELVMRGLHPDPAVRDVAAEWHKVVTEQIARPSPQHRAALRDMLGEAGSKDEQQKQMDLALRQLEEVGRQLG